MLNAYATSGSSPGKQTGPDFLVENHFTLLLLFPRSESAKIWCDEHLPPRSPSRNCGPWASTTTHFTCRSHVPPNPYEPQVAGAGDSYV
jgi:hypothetical protein